MLTEEQQEQQERRPWQLRNKKTSTSSGKDLKLYLFPILPYTVKYCGKKMS